MWDMSTHVRMPHIRLKTSGSKRLQENLLSKKGKGQEHRPDEQVSSRRPTRETRGKQPRGTVAPAAADPKTKRRKTHVVVDDDDELEDEADSAPRSEQLPEGVAGATPTAASGAKRGVPLSAVPSSIGSCGSEENTLQSPLYSAGIQSEPTAAATIEILQTNLRGKEAIISEQQKTMNELSAKCDALEKQLRERDARVLGLEKDVSALVLSLGCLPTPLTPCTPHLPPLPSLLTNMLPTFIS